ncbi:MAG: NADH-quinone oxidoreductase subunit N [Rhodospirillaceae bacterium]
MTFTAPHIDYAGLSPVIALSAGIVVVLMAGVLSGRHQRLVVSALSLATLGAAAGLSIWQWGTREDLVAGALRLDELGLAAALIAMFAAAVCIPMSWRDPAAAPPDLEPRHGDFQALLLASVLGMTLLAQAQNLIAFFVALELLSVPLYVLCGSAIRRASSLESGLKYLIVGSLGSATLLYGLSFIYGAAGSTDFNQIDLVISNGNASDSLVLMGVALIGTGLAFKISIAPFHQWTPDVYEGAPTPITAFMAVATKAAAFVALVRLLDVPLGSIAGDWKGALSVLAIISIAVGNIGAIGQDSLKRLMGWSGVAQAGYMLVGVAAATELGVNALVFYLAAYTLMNLAAFAVIVIREREMPWGDDIKSVQGLGRERPALAWPLTISMLALAGLPATSGFMGKLYLIEAAADADHTYLGVAIVIGAMISLVYYLRVVAYMWMRPAAEAAPAMAGGSPDADDEPEGNAPPPKGTRCPAIIVPGILCAAATIFFGVIPTPLVDWANHAGASIAPFL